MTFESHWASEHFEPYDPDVNGEELEQALREHDRRSLGETSTISFANLDVRPYPHQQRMLEALTIERERHDRHRNLVVAATGHRQDRRRRARLPAARASARTAICRCCSSPIARRSSSSRSRPTARCCATGRSARSTAAVGSPTGAHVFAMVQSLRRVAARQIAPGRIRRRRRRRVPPRRRHDLRPAAQAPPAERAARADRDAGAPRRPGRHRRGSTTGSRSSFGCGRRSTKASSCRSSTSASPTAPISASSPGAAAATSPRSSATSSRTTTSRREAARGDPADRARPGRDAGARLLRLQGARALHGAQVHRGRPGERRADRRRLAGRAEHGAPDACGRASCAASSRSRCSARASTCPTSTASCCFARPRPRPCSRSSSGAGCGAPSGKSHLTVIDLIGQHRREFRFEDRLTRDHRRDAEDRSSTRSTPTSRSCRPAARSTSTARAARSCSTTCEAAVRRSRWTTLVAGPARRPR